MGDVSGGSTVIAKDLKIKKKTDLLNAISFFIVFINRLLFKLL